jgi:hypothetical protein
MNTKLKQETREDTRPTSAEQRLKDLSIALPEPPEPFGIYAEAVQTGKLLFLTGMLPIEGRGAKFVGRLWRRAWRGSGAQSRPPRGSSFLAVEVFRTGPRGQQPIPRTHCVSPN